VLGAFLEKLRGGFVGRPAPGDSGHAEDEIGAADIGSGGFAVERRAVDATGVAMKGLWLAADQSD
jgi:hypothetical protein